LADKYFIEWQVVDMAGPKKEERTSSLLRRLINTSDLEEFMERNASEMGIPAFHVYITDLCKSQGKIPEQVIRQAGIERSYGHQLFNGTRKPSRDKVIQLAFGLELDLDDTQKLLQIAQKNPLYPKIKRDAAVLYCINNRKDILETQSVLMNLGLTLLGGE
jgi:transcriptional regulator with XRE-family HTH domain